MKIVTIGAGSSYTPELCEGFLKRNHLLNITEWWLVDVAEGEEKLNIIYDLVVRMVKKQNQNIKVYKTLNRIEAIKNADFITTQLRVGLLEAREKDEKITLEHGFIGQETNGAGGLFKALRTIPVIIDIVKEVKEHASKNAWIINFTNPAGLVTEAVNKLTGFKNFIGVCNVPIHTKMNVAKLFDVNSEDIKYDCAGLNHLSFFTNFYYRDKSILQELIQKTTQDSVGDKLTMKNIPGIEFEPTFIKSIQAIPSAYLRYYYKPSVILKEYLHLLKENKLRATQVREVENELFKKYADPMLDHKPEELQKRGGAYYSDVACGVLTSIVTNDNCEHTVNTLNTGFVKNLPQSWVVESISKVTSNGPVPVDREINALEEGLGIIHSIKQFEFATINSIRTKKLKDAYTALVINPLSTDDIEAKKLFVDLVIAHKKYLTYFTDLEEIINNNF